MELSSRQERLVVGYLAHVDAVAHDQEDDHFWAWELLHRLVQHRPEIAWPLVVAAVARTPDPITLNYVAADILEDMICEYAHAIIDRVEEAARADPHFRQALADVWGSNRMPPDVRARLDAAIVEP